MNVVGTEQLLFCSDLFFILPRKFAKIRNISKMKNIRVKAESCDLWVSRKSLTI